MGDFVLKRCHHCNQIHVVANVCKPAKVGVKMYKIKETRFLQNYLQDIADILDLRAITVNIESYLVCVNSGKTHLN